MDHQKDQISNRDLDMWNHIKDLQHEVTSSKSQIEGIKATQEAITKDMKETTSALRLMTTDLSVLVTNVGHLTDAIKKLHQVVDRTQQIELDLVFMKTRTKSLEKLWEEVDTIKKERNTEQREGAKDKVIIRAVQIFAFLVASAGTGMIMANLWGGS